MSYEQGFIEKCAQFGVDPDELIKSAGGISDFFKGIWHGGAGNIRRFKALQAARQAINPASGASHYSDEGLKLMARNFRNKAGRDPLSLVDEYILVEKLKRMKDNPKLFAQTMIDAGLSDARALGEGVGTLGEYGLAAAGLGYGGKKLYDKVNEDG